MKKIIYLLLIITVTACDYVPTLDDVLPDNRREYKKSEALPDLEVPPDLTTEALEDPMVIPDEQITTLSEFEQQKERRRYSAARGDTSLTGGSEDEQWITVPGNNEEIWPMLKEFWIERGFSVDLDDAELGVFETLWRESVSDGISSYRNKFKIYAEPSGSPDNTVLFLSSEREEKTIDQDEGEVWAAVDRDIELEKEIIKELNTHFYGSVISSEEKPLTTSGDNTGTRTRARERKLASIENLDDEKIFLSLPDEFTQAWTHTEDALTQAGIVIENQEKEKGLYHIIYFPAESLEEGWLDKLKFWKGDDEGGEKYQVSLTGVGDKTELVLLDEEGKWLESEKASRVLAVLQVQYNRLNR